MSTQEQINLVRQWGTDKGIIGPNGKATEHTQLAKLLEEVQELRMGIIKDDHDEKIDAIGDCTVVLILLSEIIGVPFEECLSAAYHIISQRTGKMVGGVFVKDK
jgi:NTP pyrophosphatase (non-canonical NTP hydrolase)